eukprot:TRINITY_DN17903_c1_g4_i2.p1 TRINITY_DN17903_c1_g4~~TRINITY_DN17903_c1_g4_i2.p1  ORF type:complete len:408 (+),score=73.95 TRINITY_DN17903_c1_g4_i2:58-1224(+)
MAIYPSAAIGFNHDCSPNCAADVSGPSTSLRVYAKRDIAADDELRISYVDVAEPGPVRRRDLRQQYHFECRCSRCSTELSEGDTGRTGGARSKKVSLDLMPVETVDASEGSELVDRVASNRNYNAGVISSMPSATGIDTSRLVSWASQLCNLGDAVSDALYYWQGYRAIPGEDVRAQFCRQLQDDFVEMASALSEDSEISKEAAEEIANAEAIESLTALVISIMDLFESRTSSSGTGEVGRASESRGFCLKLEINDSDPIVKFHDDWFTMRFEIALVGGGTIIAQNSSIDWDCWDECRGRIGMSDELVEGEIEKRIKAWNAKVCPQSGEIVTVPLDLVVMKGGSVTNRPCIHRAPYQAAVHPRFLLTLEKMTRAEMDKHRDMMDFDDN